MRKPRLLAISFIAGAMATTTHQAGAITTPDLGSTCTTSGTTAGTNGCFKITNNFSFTGATGQNNSAIGTSITSVATGAGTAVKGFTNGSGTGVLGVSTATATGVSGVATTSSGIGVSGSATSTSGTGAGVTGSASGSGAGVRGNNTSTGATAPLNDPTAAGVVGTSVRGYGVYGSTAASSLDTAGVFGYNAAAYGHGVMGVYQGGDNQTSAVFGKALIPGGGDQAYDPLAMGVEGVSGGVGVRGQSITSAVTPGTGTGQGVYGTSDLGVGVYGESRGTTGGDRFTGIGIVGTTSATSSSGFGVYGMIDPTADGSCAAVRGDAQGGVGVGVWGSSGTGRGVIGYSQTGNALFGYNGVTDKSAAAIVAIPGSTSALAYWGAGGIQLTGSFAEKVGGGSWSAPSDRRIKKDVTDLDRGLAELMRVRPVKFKYNGLGGTENDGKEFVGVIAQELEQVLPSMVSTRKGKLHPSDAQDSEIEVVDPSQFTFLLISAVKQQQRTIERQEARLAELERRSAPIASQVLPSGFGWAALAFLPVGLVWGRRRKRA